jgi:hypothetical protein
MKIYDKIYFDLIKSEKDRNLEIKKVKILPK